jgi:hypothetical protein
LEEFFHFRLQTLVPKLFVLLEHIDLGALNELDLAIPQIADIESLVLSEGLGLALLNDFYLVLRDEVNGALDEPLLSRLVVLLGALVEVRHLSAHQESLLFMNHDDALDALHLLLRLEEKLGLAAADLLASELGKSGLLAYGVLDDAVLVLGEHHDALLLHELLVGIDDVDVLHALVDQPFLARPTFPPVEILEVPEGPYVEGCKVSQHVALSVLLNLNLRCRHEVACRPVQPLNRFLLLQLTISPALREVPLGSTVSFNALSRMALLGSTMRASMRYLISSSMRGS